MQQEEGQAFWIYHGHSQHVQTAMVPITPEQVNEGWREIRRQEELQRQLVELGECRSLEQQAQKKQATTSANNTSRDQNASPTGKASTPQNPPPGAQKKRKSSDATNTKAKQQPAPGTPPATKASQNPAPDPTRAPAPPKPTIPPAPDPDDDEPDRL